jgi:uncharacterized protein YggU (UPF0235/DUF167 family)
MKHLSEYSDPSAIRALFAFLSDTLSLPRARIHLAGGSASAIRTELLAGKQEEHKKT